MLKSTSLLIAFCSSTHKASITKQLSAFFVLVSLLWLTLFITGCRRSSQQRQNNADEIPKWEYLLGDCDPGTEDCSVGHTLFATKSISITDLGSSGWELVSTMPSGRGNIIMIFKRRKSGLQGSAESH